MFAPVEAAWARNRKLTMNLPLRPEETIDVAMQKATDAIQFEIGVLKRSSDNLSVVTKGAGVTIGKLNFWRGLMGEGPQAEPTAAMAPSPVPGAQPPVAGASPVSIMQSQVDATQALRTDIKKGLNVTVSHPLQAQGELMIHAEGEAERRAGRVFLTSGGQ